MYRPNKNLAFSHFKVSLVLGQRLLIIHILQCMYSAIFHTLVVRTNSIRSNVSDALRIISGSNIFSFVSGNYRGPEPFLKLTLITLKTDPSILRFLSLFTVVEIGSTHHSFAYLCRQDAKRVQIFDIMLSEINIKTNNMLLVSKQRNTR